MLSTFSIILGAVVLLLVVVLVVIGYSALVTGGRADRDVEQ